MRFTVGQSVDALLNVLTRPQPIPPAVIVRQLEELIAAPSAEVPHTPSPGSVLATGSPLQELTVLPAVTRQDRGIKEPR